MEFERKRLSLSLKADKDSGEFEAVFATLDVIDHDGDVTRKGAFENGSEVVIGSWGHKHMELPVGKGILHEGPKEVTVEGKFFLDTTPGADTYKTVKELGPLGEWSYIFAITKESFGEFAGQQVRFIEGAKVFSVDPVLAGAGINTRTTDIKGSFPTTFVDDAEHALASVQALATRAKSLAELRAKESRGLGGANTQRLLEIAEELDSSLIILKELTKATPEPQSNSELVQEFLRFQRLRSEVGV